LNSFITAPVRRSRWFRQIARAACIPDEVWNMDSRAGGATEADEAGKETLPPWQPLKK